MYKVRIKKTDDTLLREELVEEKKYIYEYADNVSDNNGTPVRVFKIEVEELDDNGNVSATSELTIDNPPPAVPLSITTRVFSDVGMQVSPEIPDERDVIGMKVWLSKTDGFTADAATLAYDGLDLSAPVPLSGPGTYYYRIALIDSFDNVNYNISNQLSRVVTASDLTQGVSDNAQRITELQSQIDEVGNATAISELNTRVDNVEGSVTAVANQVDSVSASVDGANANASAALTATAQTDGKLASTYQLTLGAGDKISGIKAFNDGATSVFDILADKFSISNGSGANQVTPFRVEGNSVFMNEAHIKNLTADNLDMNTSVSLGATGAQDPIETESETFVNVPGLSGLTRTFDEDGVALIIVQILTEVNKDSRAIEYVMKTTHPVQGVRFVNDNSLIQHRFTADNHPSILTGIAIKDFQAGSHTFDLQWRVLNDHKATATVRRMILCHFKGGSFSGLTGSGSQTGGGSGAGGGGWNFIP